VIDHTLRIEAPAAQVWQGIVDLDRYPEWNPFVVACRSTLVPGDSIEMRVRLFGSLAQPQRETIFEHEPGRRLSYGLAPNALGALASLRSHEVEAITPTATRYRSHFELSGWLSPVVAGLLGGRLRVGFEAMSQAIRRRAEQLAATAGS
jgi:hypothetical protein